MSYTVRNLTIAIALAVVGIILMTSYVRGQKASIQKSDKDVKVLVAKKEIPAGTSVKDLKAGGYLETKTVVARDRDPSAVGSLSGLGKLSVTSPVYAGQQLTSHVFQEGTDQPIANQLKGTERAMMVPLSTWGGLGNYLRTGDKIDLYATQADGAITRTWLVARDVEILRTPTDMTIEKKPASEGIPKVTGDAQPFMLRVSDKVVQNILWSHSASNDFHIQAALRGSNGSLDTKTNIEVDFPPVH